MPEQRPLVVGELQGPIGVRREGRALSATGANPRVTLAIGGSLGAVGAVARIRRRCGFLRALGLL
jgi:hypothetical protein